MADEQLQRKQPIRLRWFWAGFFLLAGVWWCTGADERRAKKRDECHANCAKDHARVQLDRDRCLDECDARYR